MKYRRLGKTDLTVSEIGMGCEGFAEKSVEEIGEMLDLMEDKGVNCIDLYLSNPALRSNLGKALAGRRNKFIIQAHLCTVWKNNQYKRSRKLKDVKEGFEDLLKRLDTNYVDIGMIHYVDTVKDWESIRDGDIMKYVHELQRNGTIRWVGISSHNPVAALEAVNSGLIDVLLFSINPCYDLLPADEDLEKLWDEKSYERPLRNMDPDRKKLYETCQRKGIGITVMKAFGGGDLLSDKSSPAKKALTVNQCLHYALTRPGVASVMSGARSMDDLKKSIAYEMASDEERDFSVALSSMPRISWIGHCMYCGHCAPCPQSIDIASVMKFLNLVYAQNEIPETVREHYLLLEHKASDCIECGACETRCPFEVHILEQMNQAKTIFGI